jgi:hypothetical protein
LVGGYSAGKFGQTFMKDIICSAPENGKESSYSAYANGIEWNNI